MHSRRLALLAALIAAIAFGCKSNSAESDSSNVEATKTNDEEETVKLAVETTEPTESVDAIDLEEDHLWEDRVILLFADNAEHPEYREMAAELAGATDGVDERDLVIYHMFWERPGLVGDQKIPVELAQEMRRKHAVLEDAFTFILIGKDGTQKLRAEEAVPVETVFDRIDSMPMRKQEMKEQQRESAD